MPQSCPAVLKKANNKIIDTRFAFHGIIFGLREAMNANKQTQDPFLGKMTIYSSKQCSREVKKALEGHIRRHKETPVLVRISCRTAGSTRPVGSVARLRGRQCICFPEFPESYIAADIRELILPALGEGQEYMGYYVVSVLSKELPSWISRQEFVLLRASPVTAYERIRSLNFGRVAYPF